MRSSQPPHASPATNRRSVFVAQGHHTRSHAMPTPRPIWLFVLLAALAACGTAPTPVGFPAQALQTLPSKTQQLSVAVRTAPEPPTRGDQSVEYTITDVGTGKLLSGLSLSVVPWMPVMQHGTSVVPTVTEADSGTYVIANVDLFMAGEWALRTTITGQESDAGGDAGVLKDYVSPTFQIP